MRHDKSLKDTGIAQLHRGQGKDEEMQIKTKMKDDL
jgi:hypothetical protein